MQGTPTGWVGWMRMYVALYVHTTDHPPGWRGRLMKPARAVAGVEGRGTSTRLLSVILARVDLTCTEYKESASCPYIAVLDLAWSDPAICQCSPCCLPVAPQSSCHSHCA